MAYLAAVFFGPDGSYNVHCIREFTADQLAELEEHYADFVRLRQKLSLLHILEGGFSALNSFIKELQTGKRVGTTHALSETNRHFMNYLSSAYALREHLTTSLKHDFGHRSEQVSKFCNFLSLLEKKCFAYAFFQDFRNYVQHCGFPVGDMSLVHEGTTRVLRLTYSKSALLAKYKKWKKSGLSQRSETVFDLVALLGVHHQVVVKEFPVAILAEYGKNIHQADAYFRGLHQNAAKFNPHSQARMVLSMEGGAAGGTLTFQDIPLNPLAELGLSRKSAGGQGGPAKPSPPPKPSDSSAPAAKVGATSQAGVSMLSFKTEERDRVFEVRKNDIVGFHPSLVNLDYDPFPSAQLDAVVARVPMGRELVLHAKLKGPVGSVRPGLLLVLAGHKFAPTHVTEHLHTEKDESEFDVEATEWLAYTEPLKMIAEMRRKLAEARPS